MLTVKMYCFLPLFTKGQKRPIFSLLKQWNRHCQKNGNEKAPGNKNSKEWRYHTEAENVF